MSGRLRLGLTPRPMVKRSKAVRVNFLGKVGIKSAKVECQVGYSWG